jgi:methylated-DNA-[protein]-cysteine S-methyltransferase
MGNWRAGWGVPVRVRSGGGGANPLPLLIPCHRVVAAGGGLCGFFCAGGIEVKKRLLDFENSQATEDKDFSF